MTHVQAKSSNRPRVHVLIPAFNESANIFDVVHELVEHKRDGKRVVSNVVVCDNASTDNTGELARQAGAKVVHEAKQGYGAACLRAIAALRDLQAQPGDMVVFVDGDHSVFTPEIDLLVDHLRERQGLIIGARYASRMQRGAMSAHQRAGTAAASILIRMIWGVKVTDLGPFRALYYGDLLRLHMQDETFGWTTEMQVKAIQQAMPYCEVPVSTRRRRGRSKISGTVSGTIGAAYGIFSTIFWLWWQARSAQLSNEHYR